jgi:hypothetical protein
MVRGCSFENQEVTMSTKERAVSGDPGAAVAHPTDDQTAHVGVLRRRRFATLVASAVSFLAAVAIGAALPVPAVAFPTGPLLNEQLILRIPPDECFQSIGGPSPGLAPGQSCPAGYQARVNRTYLWSMARSGNFVYAGTGANVSCLGGALFYGATTPFQTPNNVCELAKGKGAAAYGPTSGDVRPPQVYQVNVDTGATRNITPDDPNLLKVSGLRGGASHNGVVLLDGQVVNNGVASGLGLFAFDGSTSQLLGSKIVTNLSALRVGVEASDGNLYLGARSAYKLPTSLPTGVILRWTGTKADPFKFEDVGNLPNEAFYIIEHDHHLVVSTSPFQYPGGYFLNGPGSIWMSPKLPPGGLTSADAGSWKKLFGFSDYDPDPVIGPTVAMGAMASFRGQLIVGSYLLDSAAGQARTLWKKYGTPSALAGRLRDALEATRAATIFDISNAGKPNQKVTLLYGSYKLPVYDPQSKKWVLNTNKLDQLPRLGPAGFGNGQNFYDWTWTVLKNKLYMGTWDASGSISGEAPSIAEIYGGGSKLETLLEKILGPIYRSALGGFDLWRLDSPDRPAVPETLHGYDDRSQYGVRTMVPFPDKGFFMAGTAGADNLRTGAVDPGGAEILKLTPRSTPGLPLPVPHPNVSLSVRGAVRVKAAVDFVARVQAAGSNIFELCVRLPRGFRFAANPSSLTIVNGRGCATVSDPLGQAGEMVVHATASGRPESALAEATADIQGTSCASAPAAAVAASVDSGSSALANPTLSTTLNPAACRSPFLGRGLAVKRVRVASATTR